MSEFYPSQLFVVISSSYLRSLEEKEENAILLYEYLKNRQSKKPSSLRIYEAPGIDQKLLRKHFTLSRRSRRECLRTSLYNLITEEEESLPRYKTEFADSEGRLPFEPILETLKEIFRTAESLPEDGVDPSNLLFIVRSPEIAQHFNKSKSAKSCLKHHLSITSRQHRIQCASPCMLVSSLGPCTVRFEPTRQLAMRKHFWGDHEARFVTYTPSFGSKSKLSVVSCRMVATRKHLDDLVRYSKGEWVYQWLPQPPVSLSKSD